MKDKLDRSSYNFGKLWNFRSLELSNPNLMRLMFTLNLFDYFKKVMFLCHEVKKARMFVPAKTFQLSLLFASKIMSIL